MALLGARGLPALDLAAARSVVAFGAELVETWVSPVELARQLGDGRTRGGLDARTRLTWVGPRLSLTGECGLNARPASNESASQFGCCCCAIPLTFH